MRVIIYNIIKYFIDVLNFNEQADFDPRISIMSMRTENSFAFPQTKNTSCKRSGRKHSGEIQIEKNSAGKKSHPVINLYSKELSHASISTKSKETMNFKLDDSFNITQNNISTLNISQDTVFSQSNYNNYDR